MSKSHFCEKPNIRCNPQQLWRTYPFRPSWNLPHHEISKTEDGATVRTVTLHDMRSKCFTILLLVLTYGGLSNQDSTFPE